MESTLRLEEALNAMPEHSTNLSSSDSAHLRQAPPASRLINAANLRDGGGPAVAVSFIYDLSRWPEEAGKYAVLVSEYVDRNLRALSCDTAVFREYRVQSHYGLAGLRGGLGSELRKFDLVFTIFGPCYALGYNGRHLVGFADPWVAYPRNEVYPRLGWLRGLRTRFEWFVRELFYLNSTVLVCELEHVPIALKKNTFLARRPMEIVHSAIPSVYLERERWKEIAISRKDGVLNLGLISRNYLHKNLAILPGLKRVLREKYRQPVEIYVTFADDEWQACSEEFRSEVINIGLLTLAQCPAFYSAMDVVVFPSLLECFSAVPIEALYLEKPLVASDRPFVRDCCDDYAVYFDPINNPETSAAEAVMEAIKRISVDSEYLKRAARHVQKFGSSQRRSREYLQLIEKYTDGAL
jgi:glycosyltransferase involved in cell wall biosynthesis